MHKKIIELLVCVGVIVGCIWLIIESYDLPEQIQIFLVGAVACTGLMFFIKPRIPIDFKIICFLLLGYAFAGKGFAYISPVEPIYIGEIVWMIGMLGFAFRLQKRMPLFPSWMHVMILLWMIAVGLYAYAGYPLYNKMAIRDSAIGYYAMFAYYGYAIFTNNDLHRQFRTVLKISIVLAALGLVIVMSGLIVNISSINAIVAYYFKPHPDSFLPLVAAGAMYGLLEGIRLKSPVRIMAGIVLTLMLFSTKTAGVFSFIIMIGYMVVFGRRGDLLMTGVLAAVLGGVILGFAATLDSSKVDDWVSHNDHLRTFGIGETEEEMNTSTTNWRLTWWEIVYEDTMRENPIAGAGLGSDITSHFLQEYMRLDLSSDQAKNYARYPHNVMLTVFGRMGFIGVALFLGVLISLAKLLIKATRYQMWDTSDSGKTALLVQLVVMGGIANGFVQSTFEIPYGAILQWFCVGYLIAYHRQQRINQVKARQSIPVSPRATIPNAVPSA